MCQRLFRFKYFAGNSRSAFIEAIKGPVAISTVNIAIRRYRQMDAAVSAGSLGVKAGVRNRGRGIAFGNVYQLQDDFFLPKLIALAGQALRQSPQLVQFSSSGRVPISQTLRHRLQSLHASVL